MSIDPDKFKIFTDALATITTKLEELNDALQETKDEINGNIEALLKDTQERLLKVSEYQEKVLEPNQQTIYKAVLALKGETVDGDKESES